MPDTLSNLCVLQRTRNPLCSSPVWPLVALLTSQPQSALLFSSTQNTLSYLSTTWNLGNKATSRTDLQVLSSHSFLLILHPLESNDFSEPLHQVDCYSVYTLASTPGEVLPTGMWGECRACFLDPSPFFLGLQSCIACGQILNKNLYIYFCLLEWISKSSTRYFSILRSSWSVILNRRVTYSYFLFTFHPNTLRKGKYESQETWQKNAVVVLISVVKIVVGRTEKRQI